MVGGNDLHLDQEARLAWQQEQHTTNANAAHRDR